jgi:hypothetical protein
MDAGMYGVLVRGGGEVDAERTSLPSDLAVSRIADDVGRSRIEVRWGAVHLPRGVAISLDGASARSRLVRELLEAFREERGRPLDARLLGRSLWPSEVDEEALRTRLKVTVHRLRSAGFPIITVGTGYAVDPEAFIVGSGLSVGVPSCEGVAA